MIYLDWNATAPLAPAAREAWNNAHDQAWANPGSVHAFGQQARHVLDQARGAIATAIGGAAHEWVVTSGGSESNALAISSALRLGGTAVCLGVEHSSVLRNVDARTATSQRVPVLGNGLIDISALQGLLSDDVRLVCIQFANNETGVRQDIPALAQIIRAAAPQAWIHCDAAQGPGKVPFSVRELQVDSVALAGHKCGAPKGIGLLWVKPGRVIEPDIRGGRQQQDRRSGTENAPLVAALAAALQARLPHIATEQARQETLLAELFATISAQLPDAQWLGRDAQRVPNVMSLVHPKARSEGLVTKLDLAGFAVSRGAACMAERGEPSHVIAAMGLSKELAGGAIRVSIGWTTTADELAAFAAAYIKLLA